MDNKKKSEMVTISYEVTELEAQVMAASQSDAWPVGEPTACIYKARAAARAALDARKSKYERWREGLGLPWYTDSEIVSEDQQTLATAAPELLAALIECREVCARKVTLTGIPGAPAIRAALPEDVAEEVLGE